MATAIKFRLIKFNKSIINKKNSEITWQNLQCDHVKHGWAYVSVWFDDNGTIDISVVVISVSHNFTVNERTRFLMHLRSY